MKFGHYFGGSAWGTESGEPLRLRRGTRENWKMLFRRLRGSVLAIAAVVGVIGCAASTRIVNEWRNPDYSSPRFRKILVLAASKNRGIRRTFEDEFVVKLKAAGVDAAPSYRYIPEEGQTAEAQMLETLKQADADAAVITRK